MKRIVSGLMLALLLIGIVTLVFNIEPIKAEDGLLLSMEVSETTITIGQSINITLTLTNIGYGDITIDYTPPLFDVYYCTSEGCFRWSDGMCFIQVMLEFTLEPGENYSETLTWNLYQYKDGKYYPPNPGTYPLFGLCYPRGLVTPFPTLVTLIGAKSEPGTITASVNTSKTVVGQGYNLNITVTLLNYGIYTENPNITVYANTTTIAFQDVTLTTRNSTTLTFTWNTTGFAYGNYTIKAIADTVPGETDLSDNKFTDSWVFITIPGDINGGGTVNYLDGILLGSAVGSKPDSSDWNPNADIDCNSFVNYLDGIILGAHFGQTDP